VSIDELSAARYASVTTYRKDGTPVATPVWLVRDGDALAIWTNAKTGKVKRIRRNPAVTVAPCSMRGRLRGEPVPARAEALPVGDGARIRRLIRQKYGLQGWLITRRAERTPDSTICFRITLS
jgi:PPOX class probable F420-dependent enzyme